ncbi:MAG: type II toxin-antitoxin system RelE/ParE family toxin [Nitrospirae bacterium]|nr:type II toxin-antitoxin system RelE/ParE family toxin [Nitrospirota bacterium]
MPAPFSVHLTQTFRDDLERLPVAAQEKILQALRRLETNPFGPPPKVKKLKGTGVGQWRLEVWPYRVRYDVIGREVALYRVRHRKEIYRD